MLDVLLQVAGGIGSLDADRRSCHAAYLARSQNPDGGWPGRQGASDLYYTAFGLAGVAILGELTAPVSGHAADFARGRVAAAPAMPACIDVLALVTTAMLLESATGADAFIQTGQDRSRALVELTRPFARPDGGFAKTLRSGPSSTYHTFLVVLLRQLAGVPPENLAPACQLVRSRQRADGGFVELGPLRASGTNPTAAAVGLLSLAGQLDGATAATAAEYLRRMQTPEGGWRANGQAPVADLLSTFTALVALAATGRPGAVNVGTALRFVEAAEMRGGGFRAGTWDDAPDVEYTLYGLGSLALLATA